MHLGENIGWLASQGFSDKKIKVEKAKLPDLTCEDRGFPL